MARITGGTVHYLRKVNTGNYEHKEFAADISWSADEGDNARDMMELAADEAVRITRERLGLTQKTVRDGKVEKFLAVLDEANKIPPAELMDVFDPESVAATGERLAMQGAAALPEPKRTVAPKPAKAPKLGSVEAIKAAVAKTDPLLVPAWVSEADLCAYDPLGLDLVGVDLAARRAREAETEAPAVLDPLLDQRTIIDHEPAAADDGSDPLLALPPDISDAELIVAAEKKVAEMHDSIAVRKTIGRYAQQMSMIPQNRRRAFLDELASLK